MNTWTCHICGEERDDSDIEVYSAPLKGLPGAEMNIRYCSDKPKCLQGAIKAGEKGKFPHKKIKKEIKKKKWYQFWK